MKRVALLPFGGDDDAGPLQLPEGEGADDAGEGVEAGADGGEGAEGESGASTDVGEFAEPAPAAAPAAVTEQASAAAPAPGASPAVAAAPSDPAQAEAAQGEGAQAAPTLQASETQAQAGEAQADAGEAQAEAGETQEEEGQGEGEALLPLAPADLSDLRRWLRLELASELERSGALHPLLVELDADDMASTGSPTDLPDGSTLGDIAGAAGLELAAAASVDSGWGAVRIRLVVAGADGVEKLQEQAVASYEELAAAPQALARAVLLAIGDEAAAPPPPDERPVPIDALLLLCRASRQLEEAQLELERAAEEPAEAAPPEAASVSAPVTESVTEAAPAAAPSGEAVPAGEAAPAPALEAPPAPAPEARPAPLRPSPGDPAAALASLLDSLAIDPDFAPSRTLLLEEAEHAAGGPWMPAFFAALDRLAELRPADLEASLALGDYRRLHFDEEGARELFLDVRDRAEAVEDGSLYAMASERLAALAAEAGRAEEAIAHLRAAVRFADDPALYLKLGVLLRDSDPVESMRALQRALALDRSPRIRLELGRSLLLVDEGDRAMAELSKASQGSARDPEAAAEASDLLRVILLSAQEAAGE